MLPSDIDPASRCRLPLVKRTDMNPNDVELFEELSEVGPSNIRGLVGPAGIQLHAPGLARLLRPLNRHLRLNTGIPGALRELAILSVARECESNVIWATHLIPAIREGVSEDAVRVVEFDLSSSGIPKHEQLIVDLARGMFRMRKVGSSLFSECRHHFGTERLISFVVLMGQYAATSALLCAVDMQLDEDQDPSKVTEQNLRSR